MAGTGIRDIIRTKSADETGDVTDCAKLIECLNKHFQLQKNVPMARQKFYSVTPMSGETVDNYVIRLKTLLKDCDFPETEKDNQIRDRVLLYISDKVLKSKLYRENDLNTTKLLQIIRSYHDKDALVLVSNTHTANAVNDGSKRTRTKGKMADLTCFRCGKRGHVQRECRASTGSSTRKAEQKFDRCFRCRKPGHRAADCRAMWEDCPSKDSDHSNSRGRGASRSTRGRGRSRGGGRGRHKVAQTTDANDDSHTDVDEKAYYALRASSEKDLTDEGIQIENQHVPVIIDSGATCNLIELRRKYPEVFTGLGKLKGYQLHLHIDENVKPIVQYRRIPFNRRAKVVEKLKELEKLGVIEKVSGPTSWVNPLVTVQKPHGDVRLCLDMRKANQAIVRERHPVPTMDETLEEISGAKVFCKLDMNMAFHQIELDESSRDITTFSGPNSLYRYRRLIFGVNMATEKFQNLISQVLKGCEGAHNIHDDIRVVAENYEQLYARVEKVVKRFSEHGLTLNFTKCNIGDSMIFMGHLMTAQGMKLTDEKVKAIVKARTPTDKSELRSFLGLAQFCSRYVDKFATVTSPLWDLTRKDVKWEWLPKHEQVFNLIKHKLTTSPFMAYFKQGAKTRVTLMMRHPLVLEQSSNKCKVMVHTNQYTM
ncbi:uncharacterized protein [Ptychodera flava]|uniref:uncharacterized protein n=1 Tax=Ptychodera flava TaxID=63121 RepID=UPI00396A1DAC